MDFRYSDPGGSTVEAYQISTQSRYLNQKWPPWLKMQKGTKDMNVLFVLQDDPNQLWLASGAGEQVIPDGAYLVIDQAGNIVIQDELTFEAEHSKVVPVPDATVHPEALTGDPELDNHVPVAKPVPGLDGLEDQPVTELQPVVDVAALDAIKEAFVMLQDQKVDEAIEFLADGLIARTVWCNCPPGRCDDSDMWSCRQRSPLVR